MNVLPLPKDLQEVVARALAEDVGSGDVTAALVPESSTCSAVVVCREPAVICGEPWFDEVFRQLDPQVRVEWEVTDGDSADPDQVICRLAGPSRTVLIGERTGLNFLQTLSGTATLAREYARAVAGTGVKVLDTRKTLPGLRTAQKYAVRCGGCHNHRHGLFDAILIKENHIMAAGSITAAVAAARQLRPALPLQVEVENLDEVREALAAGAPRLLLDNFSLGQMEEAVHLAAGQAQLEVSGNMDLAQVARVARTGVDFISVGALTKNVHAVDLSMRFAAQ